MSPYNVYLSNNLWYWYTLHLSHSHDQPNIKHKVVIILFYHAWNGVDTSGSRFYSKDMEDTPHLRKMYRNVGQGFPNFLGREMSEMVLRIPSHEMPFSLLQI